MLSAKPNPAKELENIKAFLPGRRAEALKQALGLCAKLSNQQSLIKEELEILVIAGTLLHENGKDAEAITYLRRLHDEVARDPSLADRHPPLAWGELLYRTLSTRADFTLALKSDSATAKKNSPPAGKTSAKGASNGAAQRAAGGGCSVVAAFVCCAGGAFAAGAILVIVSAFN